MHTLSWDELFSTYQKLIRELQGSVVIGGVAVYLHTIEHATTKRWAGMTHDGDLYLSYEDLGFLRDHEDVTSNPRLKKHQVRKNNIEFDVYVQHQHGLLVSYDEVFAHAVMMEDVRVAAIEHLMILKLEAYRDRQDSSKGQKDAQDLIRLALILSETQTQWELMIPYLDDEHPHLLEQAFHHQHIMALTSQQPFETRNIKLQLQRWRKQLDLEWQRVYQPSGPFLPKP